MTPSKRPLFLPTSRKEMEQAGYDELDILLITGDCYVDHPSFGVAIIGRLLESLGYRVGLIAQPDWKDPEALKIMGRPRIGCGVTSGNMDSMVNIYTVGRRLRKDDCFSENGEIGKRPPHALTVYAQELTNNMRSAIVFIGGLLILSGMVMAAIQLFGSGGVPFHKDKHCYLVFEELYFDRGVRADVVQSVENGAVDRLLGLARANVPALTVALYRTPDNRFAAMQAFEYADLEYKPLTRLNIVDKA